MAQEMWLPGALLRPTCTGGRLGARGHGAAADGQFTRFRGVYDRGAGGRGSLRLALVVFGLGDSEGHLTPSRLARLRHEYRDGAVGSNGRAAEGWAGGHRRSSSSHVQRQDTGCIAPCGVQPPHPPAPPLPYKGQSLTSAASKHGVPREARRKKASLALGHRCPKTGRAASPLAPPMGFGDASPPGRPEGQGAQGAGAEEGEGTSPEGPSEGERGKGAEGHSRGLSIEVPRKLTERKRGRPRKADKVLAGAPAAAGVPGRSVSGRTRHEARSGSQQPGAGQVPEDGGSPTDDASGGDRHATEAPAAVGPSGAAASSGEGRPPLQSIPGKELRTSSPGPRTQPARCRGSLQGSPHGSSSSSTRRGPFRVYPWRTSSTHSTRSGGATLALAKAPRWRGIRRGPPPGAPATRPGAVYIVQAHPPAPQYPGEGGRTTPPPHVPPVGPAGRCQCRRGGGLRAALSSQRGWRMAHQAPHGSLSTRPGTPRAPAHGAAYGTPAADTPAFGTPAFDNPPSATPTSGTPHLAPPHLAPPKLAPPHLAPQHIVSGHANVQRLPILANEERRAGASAQRQEKDGSGPEA